MTRLARTGPAPAPGIVHFGLGAFFRAHGAIYIDEAMALSGGDWGITGISLQSAATRDRLAPQGGVYTALTAGPDGRTARLVGSVREVLVAPEDPEQVLRALDGSRLVTLTVTEKGYCHVPSTGRLNPDHPDIRRDLDTPGRPVSAIGFITRGLARRRAAGQPPFVVLSCDNIPENGRLLRGLVLDFAAMIDPALQSWIAQHARFPCSMVDRIVPATTEADRADARRLTGFDDAAPVVHEPFRQWVVEDDFGGAPMPDLGAVGVELVADVRPFEHMKLRMLNGGHSALAYLGYLGGCETIADTVARPAFALLARHLWRQEIAPVTAPPPDVDLMQYADALLARFANPGIRHATWQIAMDGSQKLPQRILGTVAAHLAAGRPAPGLFLAIAAWMRYTSGRDLAGRPIDVRDPLAAKLAACWAGGEPVAGYLALREVFPDDLARDTRLRDGVQAALDMLDEIGPQAAAARVAGSG